MNEVKLSFSVEAQDFTDGRGKEKTIFTLKCNGYYVTDGTEFRGMYFADEWAAEKFSELFRHLDNA